MFVMREKMMTLVGSRSVTSHLCRRSLSTSVNKEEIARFAEQASEWWDPQGPASMLHRMNPCRVAFIRSALEAQFGSAVSEEKKKTHGALSGLRVLDVGCGVGILSEPLARLGASVVGCDASEASIKAAVRHRAHEKKSLRSLEYRVATAEALVQEEDRFDCVIASEVIEHVENPVDFLHNCVSLLSPRGVFILSSINRTIAGYIVTRTIAEYIMHLLPVGTHDWRKYPTPDEINAVLAQDHVDVNEVAGMVLNPLSG